MRMKGDMTNLLNFIPLSGEFDIVRFIEFFEKCIKSGEILDHIDTFKKTKRKVKIPVQELTEAEAERHLASLKSKIKENASSHREVLQAIISKYGGGQGMNDPLALEEDLDKIRKIKRVKKKVTSSSSRVEHNDVQSSGGRGTTARKKQKKPRKSDDTSDEEQSLGKSIKQKKAFLSNEHSSSKRIFEQDE